MPSEGAGLRIFRFESLAIDGLRHGVTGRTDALPLSGDVSFATGATADQVWENRVRWGAGIGCDARAWVCAQQVHGTRAAVVGLGDAGRGSAAFEDALPETDILLTDAPHVPLAVFCADCTPILLFDPVRPAVAVAHAGWRGTVQDAAGHAVRALAEAFGSAPGDLLAAIGPAIGPCCYDVGQEVIDAWTRAGIDPKGHAVLRDAGRLRLDLWEANRRCLVAAGVRPERIEVAGICTRCHADRFFSHRAGVGPEGRFAALIALDGGPIDG